MTSLNIDLIGEPLRQVLRAPGLDVGAAAAAGHVIACDGKVPDGYVSVLPLAAGAVIAVARALHHTLTGYAPVLAAIEKYRAGGGADFHEILAILRHQAGADNLSDRKAAGMNLERRGGYDVVDRPHMGRMVRMRRDISPQFHHMFVQQILRPHLTGDLDAVLDVGCGYGDILAELAAGTPRSGPDFFGGEIAVPSQACLRHFAELQGRDNLHGVALDIGNPDFAFLRGKKRVLVISHFALVYLAPFSAEFWRRLFGVVPEVRAVLLEPFSFSLPDLAPDPLFTQVRAKFYGIAENFVEVMRALEKSGELQITEIVPDITGLTTNSAVSLMRFQRTPR